MTAKCRLILMTFWSGEKPNNWNWNLPCARLFKYALWETHLRILTLKLVPNPYLLFHLPKFWVFGCRDSQIDHLCKNATKRLFMFRTLKRFGFNTSELITVYRDCIRPIIENAYVMWHSSLTLKQSQTLESVRIRPCKIMLDYKYVSYVNALEICDLDLLSAWREIHYLNFPPSLLKSERTNMLIPPSRQEIHGKQLRNSTNITQLRVWRAITAIMNGLSRRWEIDICRFRPIGALVIDILSTFILIKSTYVNFS